MLGRVSTYSPIELSRVKPTTPLEVKTRFGLPSCQTYKVLHVFPVHVQAFPTWRPIQWSSCRARSLQPQGPCAQLCTCSLSGCCHEQLHIIYILVSVCSGQGGIVTGCNKFNSDFSLRSDLEWAPCFIFCVCLDWRETKFLRLQSWNVSLCHFDLSAPCRAAKLQQGRKLGPHPSPENKGNSERRPNLEFQRHKSHKSHKVLDVRRQVTNGIGLFRFLIGCTHASYFTNNSCQANEPWRFRKWYQQQCQHPHCCFHPVGQTSRRHNSQSYNLSWMERLTWERPRLISCMQAHFHMSKSQDWVYMFASLSAGHTHLSSWRKTLLVQELLLSRLLDNDAHCT